MSNHFKIDFKNGIPIRVKAFVATTGLSMGVSFEYKALGGLLELRKKLDQSIKNDLETVGKKKVLGNYSIFCQVSRDSRIQIETDRDLMYALNKHGFDQSFTGYKFIITIKHVNDQDDIYLGYILELIIMGTVTANNILGCWGKQSIDALLPDARAAIDLDVDEVFKTLNAEANEMKNETSE